MKRILPLVICLLFGPSSTFAADPLAEAAAAAAQREAEERSRRLAAEVQSIQDTQEVILKRLDETRQRMEKLADEIRTLKMEQSRSSGDFATRDELRKFVEKLKEVDDKRESDKKVILESIKELAKISAAAPAARKPSTRQPAAETSEEPPYLYTVKENDRLIEIIAEYNDLFQKNGQAKITLSQVVKANSGLNPNRLRAGQKIRIPVPPKESK